MTEPRIVRQARRFAGFAHRLVDQRRKYTNEPHTVHLGAVADMVATITDDPDVVAAAWLHDVLEHTPATVVAVQNDFGDRIASLVFSVTNVSRPEHGHWRQRVALDVAHFANACGCGQSIKLAEIIDNCSSLRAQDSEFAYVYLEKGRSLLTVLTRGHPGLYAQAVHVMRTAYTRIGLPLSARNLPATTV